MDEKEKIKLLFFTKKNLTQKSYIFNNFVMIFKDQLELQEASLPEIIVNFTIFIIFILESHP
jgi:hypothetical protein